MYNDLLEQRTIAITEIFLDPNNPRFWSEQTQKTADVPDSKVPDESRANCKPRFGGVEEQYSSQRLFAAGPYCGA